MIVRGHESPANAGPGPVVAGVDVSAPSQAALEFAAEEAALSHAPLIAVCALADAPQSLGGARQMEEEFTSLVTRWEKDHPGVTVLRRVTNCAPREALLDAGDEARMLVVGSRGMLHRREQQRAAALTAGDLMTHPAVTVGPDDTVEHAARLMYARRVKRLPVTDASGHLVGIVSRADVLAVYSRPDEEIRKEICDEVILNEFLTDPARFTVTVQDGIVTLKGKPENAQHGRDLVSRVRHVQGVVAVRDRLSYPPPERPASPGPVF